MNDSSLSGYAKTVLACGLALSCAASPIPAHAFSDEGSLESQAADSGKKFDLTTPVEAAGGGAVDASKKGAKTEKAAAHARLNRPKSKAPPAPHMGQFAGVAKAAVNEGGLPWGLAAVGAVAGMLGTVALAANAPILGLVIALPIAATATQMARTRGASWLSAVYQGARDAMNTLMTGGALIGYGVGKGLSKVFGK